MKAGDRALVARMAATIAAGPSVDSARACVNLAEAILMEVDSRIEQIPDAKKDQLSIASDESECPSGLDDSSAAAQKQSVHSASALELLTVGEAADKLRTSNAMVYRWIAQRKLKTLHAGRTVLVTRDSLVEFITAGGSKGDAE